MTTYPCIFKKPNYRIATEGQWKPWSPAYYPVADLDSFCNPCFKHRYLEVMRGMSDYFAPIFVNSKREEFTLYDRVEKKFLKFVPRLLRSMLRRGLPEVSALKVPDLLIQNLLDTSATPGDDDKIAMNYASEMLVRFSDEGILEKIIPQSTEESEATYQDVLFNVRVLDCNLNLGFSRNPQTLAQPIIPSSTLTQPVRSDQIKYEFRDSIACTGNISILNIKEKEMRSLVFLSSNFFKTPIRWRNCPSGILEFYIIKEFQKLWILRKCLSELKSDGKISPSFESEFQDWSYKPLYSLGAIDFDDFTLHVDTIDHSFDESSIPSVNFEKRAGEAAIIHHLLYTSRASAAKSFQKGCLYMEGQPGTDDDNWCPMARTCFLKEKRIIGQQYPRDKSETNVFKFIRMLRDESVFAHRHCYRIYYGFHDDMIPDLNLFGAFWIGKFFMRGGKPFFLSTVPTNWEMPVAPSDTAYSLVLLGALCYEDDYEVRFSNKNGEEYELSVNTNLNPWLLESPFLRSSISEPIHCIIGKLSLREFDYLNEMQKRKLVAAIQFQKLEENTPQREAEETVLKRRLDNANKRMGEAVFGSYARLT